MLQSHASSSRLPLVKVHNFPWPLTLTRSICHHLAGPKAFYWLSFQRTCSDAPACMHAAHQWSCFFADSLVLLRSSETAAIHTQRPVHSWLTQKAPYPIRPGRPAGFVFFHQHELMTLFLCSMSGWSGIFSILQFFKYRASYSISTAFTTPLVQDMAQMCCCPQLSMW